VLTKVTLGEVDAGIVYVSDARAAGEDVRTVPVPRSGDVLTVNLIAVVAASENPQAAQDWVDLMLSAQGQQALAGYGFGTVS